jgi:hypothetical protein
MNVTLSADANLIERSRGVARQRGKSLNQLFRDYLVSLSGADDARGLGAEFKRLALRQDKSPSRGYRFDREEANDRR